MNGALGEVVKAGEASYDGALEAPGDSACVGMYDALGSGAMVEEST